MTQFICAETTAMQFESMLNEAAEASRRDLETMSDADLVRMIELLTHSPQLCVIAGKAGFMGTQAAVNVLRELHRRKSVMELEAV